jgi:hypothetical protein
MQPPEIRGFSVDDVAQPQHQLSLEGGQPRCRRTPDHALPLYDLMVLAIAVAFLLRIGFEQGFARHELPALGLVAALLMIYQLLGAPTRLGATLLVTALIGWRVGAGWRRVRLQSLVAVGAQ